MLRARTIAAVIVSGLALCSLSSPSVPGPLKANSDQDGFHRCISQGIREAIGDVLHKDGEVAVSGDIKRIVDRVLADCVLQAPNEVLSGGRAQMDAWMARAATEVEAQVRKDAPRIKAEKADEDRVGADYYLCLQRSAKLLAENSDESADLIAQAAFPVCAAQRNAVFEVYRRYNDSFEPGAMRAMEAEFSKRLLVEILIARAPRQSPIPPTSSPKPQKTPI